jgi:hypothetical protein
LVLSGAGADIRGGSLVLDYTGGSSPAAAVQPLMVYSYDAGEWDRGQFRSTTLAAGVDLGWRDASGKITITAAYAGDFNLDGAVNQADLAIWKANIGNESAYWQQGDTDYNGSVDGLDLLVLKRNTGKTLASVSEVVNVPVLSTPMPPVVESPVTPPVTVPVTPPVPKTPSVSPVAMLYPCVTPLVQPTQATIPVSTLRPVGNVAPLTVKSSTATPLVQPSKVDAAVKSLTSVSQGTAVLQAAHDAVFSQLSSPVAAALTTPLKPTSTRA